MVTAPADGASARDRPAAFALFELGFRCFYLAGATWAIADVVLWMAQLQGGLGPATVTMDWHVHEMIFGFISAIVAGFALTAVRNWTGRPTPTGLSLALLLALWVAGRIALLLAPSPIGAAIDIAFLPAIAVSVARPIQAARQRHNLFLPGILLLLGVLNLGYHASRLGLCRASELASLVPALYVVVLLETLVAGRVIPGFTGNATGRKLPRGDALDLAAVAAGALALAIATLSANRWPLAPAALLAGVLHALRLARWHPLAVRRQPLLWILHLSYAWIPAGFLLLALAAIGWLPLSAALHAFGVGATGGLIAAMTTRSARGHTGRGLRAGTADLTLYVLVHCAAAARVLAACGIAGGPLLAAGALAWSCAFALLLFRYAPWLMRPRLDGQRG